MLVMFMMFRLTVFFNFGNLFELNNFKLDVVKAFYVGAKFDTSVIAYALLPIFIYALFFSIFYTVNNKKGYSYFSAITKTYTIIISLILFLVSIVDYFFYSYFQTHISPVIYGLKNDKTSAILISMWTDYPVVKILIFIILIAYVFYKIYKTIFKTISINLISFKKWNGVIVFLIFGLYFIGMRGSLGMFPLRLDHTTISVNSFVNELVLNGPFALRIANGLKEETNEIHLNTKKTIKHYGFNSKEEILRLYLNKSIPKKDNVLESLLIETKYNKFLEENPPNIVFVLNESLSNHYIDLHSKNLNLLGQLENELENCYLFRNFLSAENSTVETLESIILGTSKAPISQSPYANYSLRSSIANPFKDSGYQTTYLTGDQLGWRNTGRFIKKQNFDKIQGFSFLEKKYTNPEYFAWGIHDEYLYSHIFDVLSESKKPQFLFTLTISNHTPYDLPRSAKTPKHIISDSILKILTPTKKIALKNFASYYYAANELGMFIKKVRTSALGENTIIIATGDHNERGMFNYNSDEYFLKRSVPLIMYIPEKYKPIFVNLNRFGSHKDIFPTIFNLALSNANYIKTGNDLFSTSKNNYFAENSHVTAGNKYGVVIRKSKEKSDYYKWKDSINYKGLKATSIEESPELLELKRKMEAHGAAMMLQFQEDVIQKQNK